MSFLDRLFCLGLVPLPKSAPRCAACGEGILGERLTALDRSWHPNHFRCGICNKPMASRFNLSHHREPFCSSHDEEAALCQCCGHLIVGSTAAPGFCGRCATDILNNSLEAETLLGGIQAHLRREGLPWWPQCFPVRMMGPEDMTIEGHSTEHPLLGMILKVTATDARGRVTRRVPEIRLLRGRPRLVQGAVLAHELGHAWLFQKGFHGLPHEVEEGFCEYCSHHWLSRNPDPRTPYLLERLVSNSDPIYGGGLRKVMALAGKEGLPGAVARIGSLVESGCGPRLVV
jgi:hypothetical protein